MTGCPGNYQYERQPPANFTHRCNPVRTVLHLGCTVLVPSGSTTVTVDWYWSKNISECGRYITEEQGRFTITTNRGSSHLTNIDRITTDLTITSPQTDTGYYWCQVNDPFYNGIFISSNKTPIFDTGTMTTCSGSESTLQTNCAQRSVPSSTCAEIVVVSTSQASETRSKTIVSPDVTYHMTRATTVTPVGVTSNTPVPSGVISNTPVPSGVINSIVISPTVTPQKTSRNIIVISTIVAVFVLLILLILLITTIIIIVVIIKNKTNSGK